MSASAGFLIEFAAACEAACTAMEDLIAAAAAVTDIPRPMAPAIEGNRTCLGCGALIWHRPRCGVCETIREESAWARAMCAGLHRGEWPA